MRDPVEKSDASDSREALRRCKEDQAYSVLCLAMRASAPPPKEDYYSFRVSTDECNATSLLPALPRPR